MKFFWGILSALLASAAYAVDGTWNVDASGTWSTAGNWAGSTIADGADATATFPDIITANQTVTLDSSRIIGNILFQDISHNLSIQNNTLTLDVTSGAPLISTDRTLTITSILAGNDGLSKIGSGNLHLSGANTFSGNISVSAGTLRVGVQDAGALGGGTFADDIALSSGATLWMGSSVNHTFTGTISGNGNLIKSGNSTLTILSTNNTYTGTTSVSAETTGVGGGTLAVTSFNSITTDPGLGTVHLPSSSLGAPTTVANGTILVGSATQNSNIELKYIGPGEITDRVIQFTFNASRDRSLNASGGALVKFVSDFLSNGAGGSMVLTGTNFGEVAGSIPANGSAGLKKTGSGTWTLSGTNLYTGPTVVSAGTLVANSSKPFGTSDVTINGGQLVANFTSCLSNNMVTVSGGTLTISGLDTMGDTNRLDVTSGTVHLDTGVKEKIGSLWLGGVEQALSTYGSTSSRAINKNDTYFSGTGVLYVGVEFPAQGTLIQLD